MKLVPYDRKKLAGVNYAKTKNFELLTEFVKSDLDCAKLEGFTNKNAQCCAASLQVSIKHFKVANVRAISRRGEVFLIRTDK